MQDTVENMATLNIMGLQRKPRLRGRKGAAIYCLT